MNLLFGEVNITKLPQSSQLSTKSWFLTLHHDSYLDIFWRGRDEVRSKLVFITIKHLLREKEGRRLPFLALIWTLCMRFCDF